MLNATLAPNREPLLTTEDAARYLNFKPRTLEVWRVTGRGPKFVRISARSVRYRIEDLAEWAAERVRSSTSQDTAVF